MPDTKGTDTPKQQRQMPRWLRKCRDHVAAGAAQGAGGAVVVALVGWIASRR